MTRTVPDVGVSRFMMLRPMVDLPQPDSPTSARVSPGCTLNDTFSTACTMPRSRDSNPEPMRYRIVSA
ncbi:hypothetical protein D3C72_2367670 [compost metagenome]